MYQSIIPSLIILLSGITACSHDQEEIPSTKQYDKMLFEVSSRINANLPMMIDSESELFSTTPGSNKLTYHVRLVNTLEKDFDVEGFRKLNTPRIRNTFCSSANMATIRKMGSTAIYRYVDKNSKEITSIEIDTKTCK